MIQPNELRIGNIYNRKHGKGWTVTVIDEKIMGGIFSDSITFALDDFEPIPLTPEWLEAAGFKDGGSHDGGAHSWKHPDMEFGYDGQHFYFYDDNDFVSFAEVSFVHQLQNLYFALTGEELTIKQKA